MSTYEEFCDKVRFLSFKMCEQLGHPAEEEITLLSGEKYTQKYWCRYEFMIREWLVDEAFRKMRNEYWTKDILDQKMKDGK